MRVAIAHEWVAANAGSEKVFAAIAQLFPEADLYCLSWDPDIELGDLAGRRVRTTFLDHRFARDKRHFSLPIMPLAWRAMDRRAYDLVITSSHGFARWFVGPKDGIHLSYVHAPMRYAWNPEIDSRLDFRPPFVASSLRRCMRVLDRHSVGAVESFAVNSSAIARRIASSYHRSSTIIPPPVDVESFRSAGSPSIESAYLVSGGRLIDYKRFDLAVGVAASLGLPLHVFGEGPERQHLERQACQVRAPIVFHGHLPHANLVDLLAGASAFLFPAIEDFGILAVEALAAGTPVVGVNAGGAVDIKGRSPVVALADEQTVEGLARATANLMAEPPSAAACRARASFFGPDEFAKRVDRWVRTSLDQFGPLATSAE